MSGIFGITQRNTDRPISPETVETMHRAMAFWGPDGHSEWHSDAAALGKLVLFNTPEAVFEKPARWIADARLAFTSEGRIDNRAELCPLLGISAAEEATFSDGEIMLRAYLKWGEDCPNHLLGDWSFAVWNPAEKRLFVARDHHGNTALYYYADKEFCAFASSVKALLALPNIPRKLNEFRLAQILTAWHGDGTQTCFEGIYRLPPAHTLTVTPEKAQTRHYWYLEDTPLLHFKRQDDYVEGLREVFTEAVRCRLRSYRPVASTLSGGLDSGSVSFVAAELLGEAGGRLQSFSSVPLYPVDGVVAPSRFGDETPFIRATAEASGNIDVAYLRSENINPLEGIRRALDIHDAPGHAAGNMFWLVDIMQHAQTQGFGTLLTGQMGNGSISWAGMPSSLSWATLLKQGKWKRAINHKFLQPLLASPVGTLARHIQYGAEPRLQISATNPAFIRRVRLHEKMRAAGFDPAFFHYQKDPRGYRYLTIKPGAMVVGARHAENSAAYGIESRDPTADKRVLEFSLAVPDRFYFAPDGTQKYPIRRMMAGKLPDHVLYNPRKGLQAADKVQRLRAAQADVSAMLAELNAHPELSDYIDIAKLNDAWQTVYTATDISARETKTAGVVFLRSLMGAVFIQTYFIAERSNLNGIQRYPQPPNRRATAPRAEKTAVA